MEQLLYLEIPASTDVVRDWLKEQFSPLLGTKIKTRDGFRLQVEMDARTVEWTCFVWELQRTTYLKVFRREAGSHPQEAAWLQDLKRTVQKTFPPVYPQLPVVDLSAGTIFEALAPHYPLTVQYFQEKIPDGEYALNRVYWWEKRWREEVANPGPPRTVILNQPPAELPATTYDLIYCGAALGVIHAAAMARLGYRVAILERGPFSGMNREWNISRQELETLLELGLFSREELETLIFKEYYDGLNKFYDGNVPRYARGKLLHTPTVLNIALNAEKLLRLCGEKLRTCGGDIFDFTEFERIYTWSGGVSVEARHLKTGEPIRLGGRVCIDAMGSTSPIALQLTEGRAFDSVCPVVGAVLSGLGPGVWDVNLGDVLRSHGDISRGRQLIWELFPGEGDELTFYLFYYHSIHPDNPGSLLDLYEDFFAILPEYKRCDPKTLRFKKATFGYIPACLSPTENTRRVGFDRLIALGDAAALQSPLVFTGFGSFVRNLPRLTELLHTALKHNLLTANDLDRIRAYQSNVAVTWLFSRAMMVPTGRVIPPERINAILNTFFDVLVDSDARLVDDFIKDRLGWLEFNKMVLRAAFKNPRLITWALGLVGIKYFVSWLPAYFEFSRYSFISTLLSGWVPDLIRSAQRSLEKTDPRLWYRLLAWSYSLSYGVGRPGRASGTFNLKNPTQAEYI